VWQNQSTDEVACNYKEDLKLRLYQGLDIGQRSFCVHTVAALGQPLGTPLSLYRRLMSLVLILVQVSALYSSLLSKHAVAKRISIGILLFLRAKAATAFSAS